MERQRSSKRKRADGSSGSSGSDEAEAHKGALGRSATAVQRICGDTARAKHFQSNSSTLLKQGMELSIKADTDILILLRPKEGRVRCFCSSMDVEGAFQDLYKNQDPVKFLDGRIEDLTNIRRAFDKQRNDRQQHISQIQQDMGGEPGERDLQIVRSLDNVIQDCDGRLTALEEEKKVAVANKKVHKQLQDERAPLGQKYFRPELQENNFQQTNLHLPQQQNQVHHDGEGIYMKAVNSPEYNFQQNNLQQTHFKKNTWQLPQLQHGGVNGMAANYHGNNFHQGTQYQQTYFQQNYSQAPEASINQWMKPPKSAHPPIGFVPQQHGIAFENPLGNTTFAPPYGMHRAQCGDPMGNGQTVLPSYFEQQSVQPTNQTNQCWQEGTSKGEGSVPHTDLRMKASKGLLGHSVGPFYFEQQSVQPTNQDNQCQQEGILGGGISRSESKMKEFQDLLVKLPDFIDQVACDASPQHEWREVASYSFERLLAQDSTIASTTKSQHGRQGDSHDEQSAAVLQGNRCENSTSTEVLPQSEDLGNYTLPATKGFCCEDAELGAMDLHGIPELHEIIDGTIDWDGMDLEDLDEQSATVLQGNQCGDSTSTKVLPHSEGLVKYTSVKYTSPLTKGFCCEDAKLGAIDLDSMPNVDFDGIPDLDLYGMDLDAIPSQLGGHGDSHDINGQNAAALQGDHSEDSTGEDSTSTEVTPDSEGRGTDTQDLPPALGLCCEVDELVESLYASLDWDADWDAMIDLEAHSPSPNAQIRW